MAVPCNRRARSPGLFPMEYTAERYAGSGSGLERYGSMAVLADRFWRGKRVFITGHSGFKGVWLSLWLQSLGAEVFGYSTSSAASSMEGKFAVPMQTFRGDICIGTANLPSID